MTRWLDPHPADIPASFADLNLPPLIAQTLVRRGITSNNSARAFLHPETLPSIPFPDIEKAVEYLKVAIRNKDSICVWGDFDVDGQTSTTLLVQTLQSLGANVSYYIPIRGKESHGVHIESLKSIIDNGAKVILTCDTGVTANEAIDYANSRGVDVIVTDHHDLGTVLPNAKAIINPKLLPADHPLANLAGVGVAYKFAEALLDSQLSNTELLDLVALGLIADVALLQGETRSLAKMGIQALRTTNRVGLKVMVELSGTTLETLTEETIGFTFAPRLNALGRLSDANPAVELLLTKDPVRARVLATQIEGLNAQRRLLTSQVYEAAEAQLEKRPELLKEAAIILSHSNWPGGVVGIVANRLVNHYHKPVILLNESEDGILRGSARSVEGLHITEAIASQKKILLNFGGHPMAAGLALQADQLNEFRKGLDQAIEKQLGESILEAPSLQIDGWLNLNEITLDLADSLESLAPFGAGNPALIFATRAVKLKSISTIGKAKEHLRLNIEDENGDAQSLFWWNGAGEEMPESESKFDVAYSLRASSYRGQKQLTLQFEEFRVLEEKPIEIREQRLEIRDFRFESTNMSVKLHEMASAIQIWAEGADKNKGVGRFELQPASEFAIYTTPPSAYELQKVMKLVRPKKIYLFGVSPLEERPEEFLNRLAGLCKYALNQKRGKTSLQDLTVAMAAREAAVNIGLEWLGASGQLTVHVEADDVSLSAGKTDSNPYLQAELFLALKGILSETSAYRKYMAKADAQSLFNKTN